MPNGTPSPFAGRRVRRRLGVIALAIALAGVAAATAFAAGAVRVIGAEENSTLHETIAADTHGHTLYALHPETTHHLLCKSRTCLQAWPPLTVHSANVKLSAGHGVEGHLGLLRRGAGIWQVTLGGSPLYRFSGDSGRDEANGEGIMSFGGTWHAVKAAAHGAGSPAMPPAPPPYGY
jgi:predicted lipoprotein with Yx(FWY)xxD motif